MRKLYRFFSFFFYQLFSTGSANSRCRKQGGPCFDAKRSTDRGRKRMVVLRVTQASCQSDGMFCQRRLQYQRHFSMFHHSVENRAEKSYRWGGRIRSPTKIFGVWIAQVFLPFFFSFSSSSSSYSNYLTNYATYTFDNFNLYKFSLSSRRIQWSLIV